MEKEKERLENCLGALRRAEQDREDLERLNARLFDDNDNQAKLLMQMTVFGDQQLKQKGKRMEEFKKDVKSDFEVAHKRIDEAKSMNKSVVKGLIAIAIAAAGSILTVAVQAGGYGEKIATLEKQYQSHQHQMELVKNQFHIMDKNIVKLGGNIELILNKMDNLVKESQK